MEIGISVGPEPEAIEDLPEEFDFVELSIGEKEIPVEEIDIDKLKETLDEKGFDLVVHLPFRQPLATSVDTLNDAVIDYMKDLLNSAVEMGAKKAVVHANVREEDSVEQLDILEEQVELLKSMGITRDIDVCFENIGQWDGPELFILGPILEEVGASMCFDTGHAFAEADQEVMEEFMEEFGHLFSHLHVQDTRPGRDLHMPIGSGDIDFEAVGERLEDFDGTACLEIFTNDNEYIKLSRQRFLDCL